MIGRHVSRSHPCQRRRQLAHKTDTSRDRTDVVIGLERDDGVGELLSFGDERAMDDLVQQGTATGETQPGSSTTSATVELIDKVLDCGKLSPMAVELARVAGAFMRRLLSMLDGVQLDAGELARA